MKGVILAGGTGSRLYPLTKVTNKHLLPVGKKPMILHPLERMVSAGLDEIVLVTGTEHMGDMVNLLGSGTSYGCSLTYRVQDQAGGIAQALGLCERFVGDDDCMVILGDNMFTDDLDQFIGWFTAADSSEAMILLKEVDDPERFGVAEVVEDKVVSIEEKPSKPKSNLAVTGLYIYGPEVFSVIKTLKPSDRGELEVTDINNHFVTKGAMEWGILPGGWTDAGTFESLQAANLMMME